MSENLSLLQLRGDACYWLQPGSAIAHDLAEVAHRETLRLELQRPDHRVVFAAPGADIRLLEIEVDPAERRHLDASLPFTLEESLTSDIETLHFARQQLDGSRYAVAVVDAELMQRWQAVLDEFAEQVPWIPEPLLLPWRAGEWTLVFDGSSVLLRYGEAEGTRIETALLAPLLTSLAEGAMPVRMLVYGEDEEADRARLPDAFGAVIEWRRGDLASACLLSEGTDKAPNLLQGRYAPQLPYARWWGVWRATAALFAVAIVVHLLAGWLDYRRLVRENQALRGEIESVYRQVNPRGAVAQAETQLRRQLGALRGDGSGGSFSGLLAPLGEAIATNGDTVLASLNYSRRSGELRVNLLAADFAEVEGLRETLGKQGYGAVLENSTRSGDRVRARLRIADSGGD